MKIVACVIYIVLVILYLFLGDYSRYWGGIFMINQYAFISLLCAFLLSKHKSNYSEQLFLKCSIFNTLTLSVYTMASIWASHEWVKFFTPYVASLLSVVFMGVSYYAWVKHRDEFR